MDDDDSAISVPPEAHPALRRGQLLILLETLGGMVSVDRLGYIEFFAANPFLIWRTDSPERTRLQLAGFRPDALSYQASPERYANRRTRLRSDLGALSAWGYLDTSVVEGRIACGLTDAGRDAATSLTSLYADAFRTSVALVIPKTRNTTEVELARRVQGWLQISGMRIDLMEADLRYGADGQGQLV